MKGNVFFFFAIGSKNFVPEFKLSWMKTFREHSQHILSLCFHVQKKIFLSDLTFEVNSAVQLNSQLNSQLKLRHWGHTNDPSLKQDFAVLKSWPSFQRPRIVDFGRQIPISSQKHQICKHQIHCRCCVNDKQCYLQATQCFCDSPNNQWKSEGQRETEVRPEGAVLHHVPLGHFPMISLQKMDTVCNLEGNPCCGHV